MNTALVLQRSDAKVTSISHVAAEGFRLLGYEVLWADMVFLRAVQPDKDMIVVGSLEATHLWLQRCGVPVPDNIDYPPALSPWLNRSIERSTLGAIRKAVQLSEFQNDLPGHGWRRFVKPADDGIKAFPGHVVSAFRQLIRSAGLPDDMPVWVSSPVNFLSEYRCFVQHDKVLSCRPYRGDPLAFPDGEAIQQMVEAFAPKAPNAYCLDVGVIEDHRGLHTTLVEVNDAYAAGDYGLDPILYARFLEARWCELTGASPVP